MSILDAIHELWTIVGEVWDAGDIAGNAAVLRAHASHWRQMQAELTSLSNDLNGSVTQNLTGGRDGNWNDQAGQNFQTVWSKTRKQIDDLAGEFGGVASELEQFAGQVDDFNNNLHQCLIVIGASLVVMAATTWIPGVDLITDGASLAADAEEVDQAWSLINMLKNILTFLRSNLVKNFVFNLGKNFAINYAVNWGSRIIERGIMLGDPTEGWSQYDQNQLLLLTGLSTVPSMVIPMTALGRWAALPDAAVGPGQALPWGQFLKASILRVGQTEILANAYNLVNHVAIQGKGYTFQSLLQAIGVGSVSTGVPTALIIGGNAVWFVVSGGTSGLPQGLTMPTLVGVNTVADVMIPGISPLVRQARGLVYVTAGGHLPSALINVMQRTTGIIGQLPTYVVKAGDTLMSIAQRQYGSAADYVYILKANHLASPTAMLHVGERLVMPAVPAG